MSFEIAWILVFSVFLILSFFVLIVILPRIRNELSKLVYWSLFIFLLLVFAFSFIVLVYLTFIKEKTSQKEKIEERVTEEEDKEEKEERKFQEKLKLTEETLQTNVFPIFNEEIISE